MNWQEVINTYPQAWLNFQQYVYHTLGTFTLELPPYFHSNYMTFYEHDELHGRSSMQLHNRELYDFFDTEGIIIEIIFKAPNFIDKQGFNVAITFGKSQQVYFGDTLYPTRTEAEEQAFLRAFQLLEEKLKS